MSEGYYCEDLTYYCSDECLAKDVTPEHWEELYNDGEGDSCYTSWEREDINIEDFTLDQLNQLVSEEYYTKDEINTLLAGGEL